MEDDKVSIPTHQIEKLKESNYRSWSTMVRAILRERKLFAVVEGIEKAPLISSDDAKDATKAAAHAKDLEAFELRQMRACTVLLATISPRLITYVEDVDDNPVEIWNILKNRYKPMTQVTRTQVLRELQDLKLDEGGDMEVHVREFRTAKRRVEEQGLKFDDDYYKTMLLLSVSKPYEITVSILESMPGITTEIAINRLLEEYRKKKAGDKSAMALLTKQKGKKAGKKGKSGEKADLKCNHCQKLGHVENERWTKNPQLRPNKKDSLAKTIEDGAAKIAFHTTVRKADLHIGSNGKGHPCHWILDSGASEHFSPYRHLFETYERLKDPVVITTAEGEIYGVGKGSISLTVVGDEKTYEVILKEVIHAPDMDSNLVSTSMLLSRGLEISMHPIRGVNILKNGKIIAKTITHGKLHRLCIVGNQGDNLFAYEVKETTPPPKPISYDVWHRRLAHLGKDNVLKLPKLVIGMAIIQSSIPTERNSCEPCIQGKQHQNLINDPAERKRNPGDRVHSDICGPILPMSIGKAHYFTTFTDEAIGMVFWYPLKTKTAAELCKCFLEFKNEFEQDGRKIRALRTDGGDEYERELGEFLKKEGIRHETSPPYTPEQNGIAERVNRTIVECVRAILAETHLPKELWAELAATVVYLKNRSPIATLKTTPYEAYNGKKPDLTHLRAIGTKVYVHIPKEWRKKLDWKSMPHFLVGYGGRNQYRAYDPVKNDVVVSRDVEFLSEIATIPGPVIPTPEERPIYDCIEIQQPPLSNASEEDKGEDEENEDENLGPIATAEPELVTTIESEAIQQSRASERPGKGTFPSTKFADERFDKQTSKKTAYKATTAYMDDPKTLDEAINHPIYGKQWERAILEEYNSLMKNKAWKLVSLPPDRTAISCKWLFKYKYDEFGNIIRFKARLVIRGFSQIYGVDYLDTYAPVAKLTTLRILFAIAAIEDLEIHQMDVVTAFLLSSLEEEIYMQQPEGFVQGKDLVCKLLKSLYGLKQAARVWNAKLSLFLINTGFRCSEADHCLFINDETHVFIAIWVDDLIILGKSIENINRVKAQLSQEFDMKDLGELKHFLGIRVNRNSATRTLTIDQEAYIRTILERFDMQDSKPVSTPIASGTKLFKADIDDETIDQTLYQSIIGSQMYGMLCTRPDMAYAISQTSQYCSQPTTIHLQVAKRGLRNLNGTITKGIHYSGSDGTMEVVGYADADHGSGEDRKSISGHVFMLGGGAVSWQAKKQSTVALSSTEGEYGALTQAAKEFLWIQQLLKDLGRARYAPKILFTDNQGAIALAKNPQYHARTKHIDIQLHFIRECVNNGKIHLDYCPTEDMIADIMTKALEKKKHERFMAMMGMETTMPSLVEDGCSDTEEDIDLAALAALMTRNSSGSVEIGRLPRHANPKDEMVDW